MLLQTSRRAGFPVHSPEYYSAVWEELGGRGLARLLMARYEGDALAGAMVLTLGGRACHVYAASASEGRRLKPNDLLQWEAIRRAQAEGRVAYDLWGIPDEIGRAAETGQEVVASEAGGLWGAYQFKRGFGGQVVRYAGAYDWVLSPSRYWLWRAFQAQARHLRAKVVAVDRWRAV
jgi:lipid II:glycine glycyltransferase (peptidoglycan interpeptide bridge formation enzyme)